MNSSKQIRPKNRVAYKTEYNKLVKQYSYMSSLFFGASSHMGMDRSMEREIGKISKAMKKLKRDYESRYKEPFF